jgi:gas vesicle protein
MGKFLLGLVIGVIVGVLAMAYNPNLPEEVRTGLAEVTALVMRGTERVAETVGGAADEAADEAGEAAREAEGEATGEPGMVVEEPVQENPPAAAQ